MGTGERRTRARDSTEEAAEAAEAAEEAEEAEEAEAASSDRMVWVDRPIQSTAPLALVMSRPMPCPSMLRCPPRSIGSMPPCPLPLPCPPPYPPPYPPCPGCPYE